MVSRIVACTASVLIHVVLLSNFVQGGFWTANEPPVAASQDFLSYVQILPAKAEKYSLDKNFYSDRFAGGEANARQNDSRKNKKEVIAYRADRTKHLIGLNPDYYRRREELSEPPTALTYPNIQLPGNDDLRFIGSVIVHLYISENGKVDKVKIDAAMLPDEYVSAIVAAFKKVKFRAGMQQHEAVKSQLQYEVNLSVEASPNNMWHSGR